MGKALTWLCLQKNKLRFKQYSCFFLDKLYLQSKYHFRRGFVHIKTNKKSRKVQPLEKMAHMNLSASKDDKLYLWQAIDQNMFIRYTKEKVLKFCLLFIIFLSFFFSFGIFQNNIHYTVAWIQSGIHFSQNIVFYPFFMF